MALRAPALNLMLDRGENSRATTSRHITSPPNRNSWANSEASMGYVNVFRYFLNNSNLKFNDIFCSSHWFLAFFITVDVS